MASPYDAIPAIQLEALQRYIRDGTPPGNFLTAVLRNDLKEAVARADATNQPLLALYVQWLYNRAPFGCWGTPEQVERWTAKRRAERDGRQGEVPW